MVGIIPTPFIVRFCCTLGLFLIFKIWKVTNPLILVSSLFVLDDTDRDFSKPFDSSTLNFFTGKPITPKGNDYHIPDKIADILTYGLFLILFGNIFDPTTLKLLWLFVVLRFVGVILFATTKNQKYLILFPDFINSTMIVFLLREYVFKSMTQTQYYISIGAGMLFKLWFEIKKYA